MSIRNTVAMAVMTSLTLAPFAVLAQGEGTTTATKVQASEDAKTAVESSTVKEDKNPLGASVSMGYSFNQMQFVECTGQDCGWQRISVGMGVSYSVAKYLSLSSGLNAGKTLETSYTYSGTASRTTQTPWEVQDFSLSASFPSILTIPVVDIQLSGSLGLGFPLSKPSRAAGLIMSVSPGLRLSWSAGGFSVGVGGGYTYFLNDDPTVPIDCDRAPYNCVVSGNDSGNPNALHSINGSLRLGYSIIKQLSISTGYSISRGMKAVEYSADEATAQYAQSGDQWSLERHSFNVGMSYRPFKKTSISVSMRTGGSLYTADNSEVQLPFYDGSLRQAFRTSYSVGLSQSL
ncbi:MAG: hypothetical protein VX589_10985 [Myxococcota bacterium]|nr:hypothetical protein [Myxococcota bacterium]